MAVRTWRQLLLVTIAGAVLTSPLVAAPLQVGRGRGVERVWQDGPNRNAYDRGHREGLQQGEQDARSGRPFDFQRASAYRSGDRGYNRQAGSREGYRIGFREGFAEGYRTGFDRLPVVAQGRRNDTRVIPRVPRGYQEPAHARGYSDGFARGRDDGSDRDRYDPVGHRDYREADQGYARSYGSKDAYKNNYRAGFRQGYEDGYRDGGRSRR